MRALVISDTHFGAWTGRDLLREEFFLERLAPQLEGIDELIFLGDLFDFLFGSVGDAVDAATGLLDLIAANLVGKRLVFLAGNHDHHLVHRDVENRLEAQLAAGRAPLLSGEPALDSAAPGPGFFRSFLTRRLPGVQIEIAYPTYSFAGVLCTHGHYLDPHARLSGSRGDRILTRVLWGIATGGPEDPKTIADYESTITLLTEWLYIAAQMPHGTHAQQNVFRAVQRAGRLASTLGLPARGIKRLAAELRDRGVGDAAPEASALPSEAHFDSVVRDRGRAPAPRAAGAAGRLAAPRLPGRLGDLAQRPLRARARGLRQGDRQPRLGQARRSRSSLPTPTSRWPTCAAPTGRARATGTPAPGSTSPIWPRARPTGATCATPGPARRS